MMSQQLSCSHSCSSVRSSRLPRHVPFREGAVRLTRRHHARESLQCNAFFQQLLSRLSGPPKEPPANQYGERPLYKPAEMKTLGGLSVSPMGLGTWSWGNRFLWAYDESMDPELREVFNLVVRSGINIFDTADSYGTGKLNGKSEALLGEFIQGYPGSDAVRDQLHVATKFAAYPWRITPGSVVAAARGSLQRLGGEQISLGQLHWSTANYQPLQELALQSGLAQCYEEGVVRAVGVSNYGPKQLRTIHKALAKRDVPLASAQIQFSLLSWGGPQQELKALCDDLGVRVIAYSPLALGLLSGKYSAESLPPGPRGLLFRQLLPEVAPVVEEVRQVAAARNRTMSQVAINWCMCKGTVPIPGAKSLAQAQDNLGALGWALSDGEEAALDAAAARVKKGMVQNIFQTS